MYASTGLPRELPTDNRVPVGANGVSWTLRTRFELQGIVHIGRRKNPQYPAGVRRTVCEDSEARCKKTKAHGH